MAIKRTRAELAPVGADGAAVATKQVQLGRPGVLRFIQIDYQNLPATTDIVIKRDSSAGATILTRTSSNTDIGPIAVGTAGMDEGQAASAATDALSGGLFFSSGFYIDVAEADGQTSGNELLVVDFYWEPLKKKSLTLTTDGSGDATKLWTTTKPGVVRAIAVDYSGTADAATTMTINRDALNGTTVFTKDGNETDFGPTAVGTTAGDETFAATAATDAVNGGIPFNRGLGVTIASGGASKTNVVSLWYE